MASKYVRRPFPGPPPASPSNSSHSSSSSSSTAGSFSDSSSNSGSSFWSERSLSTSLARLFLNDYRFKGSGSLPFSHQNSKTENTSSLLSGRELHKQSQTIKESENGKATEEVGTQTAHEIAENVSSRDKISQTHRRKPLPAGLPVAGDGLLRTLLSKSAQSVPALFALSGVDAIDYSQSGEDAEKRGNSAANSDGGKQLVRRRSFSRKSLLVPDRVVRRQSVPPRRGPPLSFRVAKMNIKKQQQAGKQQQSSALPPITETRVVARGRLPFAKAAKKKAVAVDWTGVPKLVGGWRKRQGRKSGNGNNNAVLGRKPVEDNANLMKGAKRVVIINRIGRRKPKVISAKSAAMEEDEMEAENWQMKENNNKREKHRRLAAVDGDGTLAKSSFQQQPLPIRPVKGRVLRPMLDKNQIKGKNQAFWANPPTGKPFITGKAPELFSKPVFLNSLPRPVLK